MATMVRSCGWSFSWLMLVSLGVAACGRVSDGGSGGDAGTGGQVDAGSNDPDAQPSMGEASIRVSLEGQPTMGLLVVFHDSQGNILAELGTDAAGLASWTIERDSMVTVALTDRELVTFFDVQPFDELSLTTPVELDSSDAGEGTVTITSSDLLGSGHFYRVELGSDFYVTDAASVNETFTIPVQALNDEGKFHVIVTEYDTDNEPHSFGVVSNITPDADSTTAVAVPTPFSSNIPDLSVSIAGAPADSGTLSVESYNRFDGLFITPSWFGLVDRSADVLNGSAATTVPYLGTIGEVEAHVRLSLTGAATFKWIRRRPRPAAPIALDADDLPPRFAAILDTTMPARPAMTWTADKDPANGDTLMANVSWKAADEMTYSWIAYVPPDADGVQMPVLPEGLAAFVPQADAVYNSSTGTTHVDLESLDGYDAFRSQADLMGNFGLVPVTGYEVLPESETGMVISQVRAALPE